MPYSIQSDLETAAGDPAKLLECCSRDDGTLDIAAMDAAIAAADAWIDSHAGKRLRPSIAHPVPPLIVQMSSEIAVYKLRARRRMLTTEDVTDQERRDLWLRDLAKGLVTAGVEPAPEPSEELVSKWGERPADKDVGREKLKGYW